MKYVLKKASAIGLLLAMALCIGTPAFAGNDAENETYAEVSYYSSENEIDILRESNTQVNDFFLQLEDANPNLELVGVVVKSMYMEESYDENGIVTECNFLTNKEVEEAINPLSGQSFVGDDYTTRGKLTITLAVYKDGDYYRLMGGSSWSGRDNSNPEGSPAAGRDYIAISWGGGGNLQCLVAPQMYGSYSDNSSIVFSNTFRNESTGYCWDFYEEQGGKYAKDMHVYASVKKINTENLGEETSAKLTYIHSYNTSNLSINGFYIGSRFVAPSLVISGSSDCVRSEIDVPNITY